MGLFFLNPFTNLRNIEVVTNSVNTIYYLFYESLCLAFLLP